jgi:flagellum-specific peptidoglycan hydrolase FlgJ
MAAIFVAATLFPSKKYEEDLELNKKNLYAIIKEMNIDHPDVVYAQAILESGDFKSRVCKINNNLFGMKVPKKRPTTAVNESGYAKYTSWIESVKDYKLYQDHVTKNKDFSRSQYLSILSKGYSETPDYVSRLHRVIRQNKHYIN